MTLWHAVLQAATSNQDCFSFASTMVGFELIESLFCHEQDNRGVRPFLCDHLCIYVYTFTHLCNKNNQNRWICKRTLFFKNARTQTQFFGQKNNMGLF